MLDDIGDNSPMSSSQSRETVTCTSRRDALSIDYKKQIIYADNGRDYQSAIDLIRETPSLYKGFIVESPFLHQ